jgi:hypothetical protein
MRHPIVRATLAFAALVASPGHAADPEPSFSPAAIRAHVAFLADDLLEGRKAGTRGYDIAARYVATRFETVGLTPPVDGQWYQRVPLIGSRLSTTRPPVIVIGDRSFAHKSDALMSPSVLESTQAFESAVVFAGYCIDRPELGMDDYAGLDVKGKFVACLSGFPKGMASDIGAHLASRKALMAERRGAVGLIYVATIQSAKAYPWQRSLEQAGEPAEAWVQADGTAFREAPGIRYGAYLNTPAAEALFAGAPTALAEILAQADLAGGKPRGFALKPVVRFARDSELHRFESPNVLGLLPGSDPARAGEVVVLMAHLDHIGVGPEVAGDAIRNGAIDNAMGVATLLEVARALAQAPVKPARSILFAAVTGEESGLLGSQFLARNPVAGTRAVAVVTLDAPILLYDFTDVIAFGAEHSTMGPIIARAVAAAGVRSSPDPIPEQGVFTRSDHYSFVKEGVPGVFLVTGFANGGEKLFREYLEKYYHRPNDDMNLPIDWRAAAKFARINYLITRDLAGEAQRPLWYEDSLFGKTYAPKEPKARR